MIFISHASSDDSFVSQLSKQLTESGYKTWVDHFNVPLGHHWDVIAQQVIAQSELMILVLSPDAINSSNVMVEYKEFDRLKKPIFPIMLHKCEPPMLLRYRQMLDFTNSRQQKRQLARLLDEIKTRFEPSIDLGTEDSDLVIDDERIHTIREQVKAGRLYNGDEIVFDEVILALPFAGQSLKISFSERAQFMIGRQDEYNAYRPEIDLASYGNATHVSRVHALIQRQGRTYWLRDVGAKNGTFIGQTRLAPGEPMRLKSGMVLHFGDVPAQIFFRTR